jgi:hypothetical protein
VKTPHNNNFKITDISAPAITRMSAVIPTTLRDVQQIGIHPYLELEHAV